MHLFVILLYPDGHSSGTNRRSVSFQRAAPQGNEIRQWFNDVLCSRRGHSLHRYYARHQQQRGIHQQRQQQWQSLPADIHWKFRDWQLNAVVRRVTGSVLRDLHHRWWCWQFIGSVSCLLSTQSQAGEHTDIFRLLMSQKTRHLSNLSSFIVLFVT